MKAADDFAQSCTVKTKIWLPVLPHFMPASVCLQFFIKTFCSDLIRFSFSTQTPRPRLLSSLTWLLFAYYDYKYFACWDSGN
jgi:hypothetical protein